MNLGELHEDFDIELAKIKVPNTAMQWINNTQQPIKEGYIVIIDSERGCISMSEEEPGKRTAGKLLVSVFPMNGIKEVNLWPIISLIEK